MFPFSSPSPSLGQYHPSMNFSAFPRHHPQPSFSHQHQAAMLNPDFYNPFFSRQQHNFMAGHHHHRQWHAQLQQQQFRRNHFQLPPPSFNLPSPASSASAAALKMPTPDFYAPLSPKKDETPREIFFRTLATSLKEANKFYSGKSTTWKNPFLYKSTLCLNYSARSFCRFGVNCWYAHGEHELRCIPESDELPDPAFIIQYLSFLGLPSKRLEQIILRAYYVAKLQSSPPPDSSTDASSFWSSSRQSPTDLPSFDSTRSVSPASFAPSTINETVPVAKTDPIKDNTPKPDKFCSSFGGWADIQSALNSVFDDDEDEKENEHTYETFANNI